MARYVPKHRPWPHQAAALKKMAGREAFALLMAMRTGKTKVLLDDFGRLEANRKAVDLMVCAPAGVYRTWEDAIEEHVADDLRRRLNVFRWSAKDGAARRRDLDDFMGDHSRPRVLLVNSEATSRVKRAREMICAFLQSRTSVAAYDESTSIKGEDSERAWFAVEEVYGRSDYRRILTGLVSPKNPLDTYMQFRFLDPAILGYDHFSSFRARFAKLHSIPVGAPMRLEDGTICRDEDGKVVRREVPTIVGFRDVERIHDMIAPHSHRVTLRDCYADLPEKMYSFLDVEMHEEQRRVYEELRDFATAALGQERYVTTGMVITQMLRLHQVLCGHVVTEDGQFVEMKENRTRALCDMLADHDGKAIVWCAFDHDVRKVADALQERANPGEFVARFWGGNRSTREEEERRFRLDPACRRIVATPGAGGKGREWSVADLVVYYSYTNNLDHLAQSEERAQSMVKKESVGYVFMRTRGTVEDKFVHGLRYKIDLNGLVNGDNYQEWII